ncbi:hypothetical protein [Paraburkholderia flagellata]|uniref:hypothetical protein n=1 Tax=Paraburkholderia flagellata TaxID=2883241 RepID=UPI0035709CA8
MFDCVEFGDALRWIDATYDLAFCGRICARTAALCHGFSETGKSVASRALAELSGVIGVSSVALVRDVLNAGYSAIVDATFLEATHRERRCAVGLNTSMEIEAFSREPWWAPPFARVRAENGEI